MPSKTICPVCWHDETMRARLEEMCGEAENG